jgi:hypothetical protein
VCQASDDRDHGSECPGWSMPIFVTTIHTDLPAGEVMRRLA